MVRRLRGHTKPRARFVLKVAPIPQPLWQQNLRNKLGQNRWRKLRKSIIEQRGSVCEVCKSNDGGTRYLHEEWKYEIARRAQGSSAAIAKLKSLKILCWLCHAVEHFGRTIQIAALGHADLDDVIAHAMTVNEVTRGQFEHHVERALVRWERLGLLPRWIWRIDFGAYSKPLWQLAIENDADLKRLMTTVEFEEILAGESPIRVWRKKRRLTQAMVAKRAGIWWGYRALEQNPILTTTDDIKCIARALRVPPTYLALDYDVRALWKNSRL